MWRWELTDPEKPSSKWRTFGPHLTWLSASKSGSLTPQWNLHGAETWRTTAATLKKMQTFVNTYLRRMLRIRWTETISNRNLFKWTKQPAEDEILHRRWKWTGHTLRKPLTCITRPALTWNPQGKREQSCPRNTWRRGLEAERERSCYTWRKLERLAQDRDTRIALVGGLCSSEGQRQ